MLALVGLGLHDEKDLTIRGLELAKAADRVYIELYTSNWFGSLKNLEKIVGKKIEILARKDLEEDCKKTIERAKKEAVVIFVLGDPLVATTHATLISDAKKAAVEVKIIHNASIVSAIAETGLHLYKFGATVTIPFAEKTKGKLPESVYETIKETKSRGLHTLCLLDVVADEEKFMTANEGMKILLELESKRKEKVFTDDTMVVVFARAGSDDFEIFYGSVAEILKKDFGKPPMVLIISGVLHFTEKEFLEKF